EVSVAIAVSAPHRAEAFDAARYIIEELKKRLPVWKREHYVDRDAEWLDGHLPATEAKRGQ
ncbi:MAG: molybdenum cofactor biosynthesis protein MoaE, partial [Gemmatimonadetes bacterium]|nr:molybdenum cofactor biosynthesis protein MoaE [Gemmatimonadota bacterium]